MKRGARVTLLLVIGTALTACGTSTGTAPSTTAASSQSTPTKAVPTAASDGPSNSPSARATPEISYGPASLILCPHFYKVDTEYGRFFKSDDYGQVELGPAASLLQILQGWIAEDLVEAGIVDDASPLVDGFNDLARFFTDDLFVRYGVVSSSSSVRRILDEGVALCRELFIFEAGPDASEGREMALPIVASACRRWQRLDFKSIKSTWFGASATQTKTQVLRSLARAVRLDDYWSLLRDSAVVMSRLGPGISATGGKHRDASFTLDSECNAARALAKS